MPTQANEAPAFTVPNLVIVRTLSQAPLLRMRSATPATPLLLAAEARDDSPDDDPTAEEGGGADGTAEAPSADMDPDVLGSVEGHFSLFNTWYSICSWWEGDFMESVSPGAFTKTFAERGSQIVSAFDHGFDPYIGDKILGPFTTLDEDDLGGAYAFDLLDATYARDLMPALKRGLYGSSFRFQVIKDQWNMEPGVSDYNPTGLPERTLLEVRVFELGPVTYPASPTASAAMRSGTDRYYELLRKRDPNGVEEISARIRELRTAAHQPTPAAALPAAESTGAVDQVDVVVEAAAPQVTDEPAQRHSDGMTPAQRRERLYPSLLKE